MVSISKLYLKLRKKLLFVSVLPIEKVRSRHMTLGREVIFTGYYEFCAIFRRDTNLKLQFLPYSSPFFYLAFDNKLKASKANPALFFKSSKPHDEVKSTDMHCIRTTNLNKCRGKKTTRKKKCVCIPATKPAYI